MRTPARARASTTANLFIEHSVPVHPRRFDGHARRGEPHRAADLGGSDNVNNDERARRRGGAAFDRRMAYGERLSGVA
jgi:hypothetical protein